MLRPFESLRREVDRLFDEFDGGFWRSPFRSPFFDHLAPRRGEATFTAAPAVDVSETDKAYEITTEMPGIDEKDIQEDKEEKNKDYYMRERSFGSFERNFQVPDVVETDRIEANFKNGVLSLTLPKSAAAQKAEKKITVKGG